MDNNTANTAELLTTINASDYDANILPIAIATDANYAKYVAVLLQSIAVNASTDKSYLIIILDCGGFKEVSNNIYQQIAKFTNFKLLIVNMEQVLQQHKDAFKEVSYFSIAMYARLFIPAICAQFKYVLYMDVDMICNLDVSEIFTHDLVDNYIGATSDLGYDLYRSISRHATQYAKDILGLEPDDSYINSGLLLFNINKWNELNLIEHAIKLSVKHYYMCPDQDIINIMCKHHIYLLYQKYNVLYAIYLANKIQRAKTHINKSPYLTKLAKEYNDACNLEANIIHYNLSFEQKPWNTIKADFLVQKWWFYCAQTTFYNDILKDCLISNLTHETYVPNRKVTIFGLPLLKITRNHKQFKYYFCGVPIFKIRIKNKEKIWYLLCFIKLFTIKYY